MKPVVLRCAVCGETVTAADWETATHRMDHHQYRSGHAHRICIYCGVPRAASTGCCLACTKRTSR